MNNSNFKYTEIGYIPNEWEVKALGEICEIITKGTTPPYFTSNGVRFIKIENFINGKINLSSCSFVDAQTHNVFLKRSILQENDILFAIAGATVGKNAIICKKLLPANTNQALAIVRLKDKDNVPYVQCVFNSKFKDDFIRDSVKTGAQPNLTLEQMYNFLLPLPPLPEQRRIAAALSDIDALIDNLDALIDKKRLIKQATMQQLLSGKKRINGFCDKWVEYTIEDIAEYRRGSFPQPYGLSQWYGGPNAYPFVQVADVANEGFRLNNKTQQMISVLAQRMSVFVPKGTVLVTLQGSIGRVAITQYDSYVDRTLAIFENYKIKIDKSFFAYKLSETFYYEAQKAPGGIIKTITKDAFSSFSLLLPPSLAEQTAISKILSDMDEEISLLEAKKEKYTHLKQGMMSELLSGRIRI